MLVRGDSEHVTGAVKHERSVRAGARDGHIEIVDTHGVVSEGITSGLEVALAVHDVGEDNEEAENPPQRASSLKSYSEMTCPAYCGRLGARGRRLPPPPHQGPTEGT